MSKSQESPKKYTQKEMAEIEKSRALSDAELLKGGAEYRINEKEEKLLIPTKEQKKQVEKTAIYYPLSKNASDREKYERFSLIEQELLKLRNRLLVLDKNLEISLEILPRSNHKSTVEWEIASFRTEQEKLREKIIKLKELERGIETRDYRVKLSPQEEKVWEENNRD